MIGQLLGQSDIFCDFMMEVRRMGAYWIGGGVGLVILIVSVVLARRNKNSRTIHFVPGLTGILLSALLLLFSLFQPGFAGFGYLFLAVIALLASGIILLIMLLIGNRIAGRRSLH